MLCACESVSGVQTLTCSPSTCTEVCVTCEVFAGCHRVAVARIQQRPGMDVGYSSPFGHAGVLNTSHPVEQTGIPAERDNPVCNVTLLLPDLSLCLNSCLNSWSSLHSALPGFLLPKWSRTKKYLVSKGASPIDNFLHFFLSLF